MLSKLHFMNPWWCHSSFTRSRLTQFTRSSWSRHFLGTTCKHSSVYIPFILRSRMHTSALRKNATRHPLATMRWHFCNRFIPCLTPRMIRLVLRVSLLLLWITVFSWMLWFAVVYLLVLFVVAVILIKFWLRLN